MEDGSMVGVTQADRDAAAAIHDGCYGEDDPDVREGNARILSGERDDEFMVQIMARHRLAHQPQWQGIETAPKDGTRILVQLRNPLPVEGRPDLERWHSIPFVAQHIGVEPDGFDVGWQFAAPVGHGGFPDNWIAGWMPLPEPPQDGGR